MKTLNLMTVNNTNTKVVHVHMRYSTCDTVYTCSRWWAWSQGQPQYLHIVQDHQWTVHTRHCPVGCVCEQEKSTSQDTSR